MNFVAMDVETANSRIFSICQIGIAEYAAGGLVSEWETLVNPQGDFDSCNIAIHGITDEVVFDAPILPEVYGTISQRLKGKIVVCHTQFDRIALARALKRYKLRPIRCAWLDSAQVARRAWEQFSKRGYGLKNVCAFLGYEFDHHNALADAKAAGFIILEACRHAGLNIGDWLHR